MIVYLAAMTTIVTATSWAPAEPASATRLCKFASEICVEPDGYPAETPIEASLEGGTQLVLNTIVDITCASSLKGKTSAESGAPLPGEVSALSFSECKRENGSKCTVATQNLPYAISIEATENDDGTLSFASGGSGTPEVRFTCGLSIDCFYAIPTLAFAGGEPAKLAVEGKATSLKGVFCPETATWDMTYVVSTPEPVFVEKVAGKTRLCKFASEICVEPDGYPAETPIEASLEGGTQLVLNTIVDITCASSLKGKTSAESGAPLPGEVSALSFSECKRENGSKCTVATQNLPYAISIEATENDDGTLSFASGGSGTPEVRFTCGLSIDCFYAIPTLAFAGGEPAKLAVEGKATSLKGVFCPETATWDMTYVVSTPEPVFVEKVAGKTRLCKFASEICVEPDGYPAETPIEASLEGGTQLVLNTIVDITCASSLKGKTSAESGAPLPGEVSALSFSECKRENGSKCTVATQNLPYAISIEATENDDGTLSFASGGSGTPEVRFTCGLSIDCFYAIPTLAFAGGEPAKLAVEGKATSLKGVFCPETATWDMTYVVSTPEPVFVEE